MKFSAMIHPGNIYRGLFLILFVQAFQAFSQNSGSEVPDLEDRPLNNVFINILGDGSIASLNYERLFPTSTQHSFIAAGLGVGLNSLVEIHANNGTTYTYDLFPVIPHHITGNIGGGRHFFEFGLGGAILANEGGQHYLPYATIGYRLLPLNSNRVNARVFVCYPLQSLDNFDIIYVPAGISVGWSFD
jgi:hypothetical protein